MKILVIDNYDSFTYNLVFIIRALGYGSGMSIFRNDKISVEEVEVFDKILLSPGPGLPETAGIMKEAIRRHAATKSILGICLGHQAIAEVFGGELFNLQEVLHGVPGKIIIQSPKDYLFAGVPQTFTGCHYHSWAVSSDSLNGSLEVTALDDAGRIMGISHRNYDVKGLQFHPESILTENGGKIVRNWLEKRNERDT